MPKTPVDDPQYHYITTYTPPTSPQTTHPNMHKCQEKQQPYYMEWVPSLPKPVPEINPLTNTLAGNMSLPIKHM